MSFIVLIIGVLFVVVTIAVFKLHPFLALILAALLVGIISPVPLTKDRELKSEVTTAIDGLKSELEAGTISEEEYASRVEAVPWDAQRKWQKKTDLGQTRLSMELTAKEFGATAGAIGIVIVLAAIIGQCLLESGAADMIIRRCLALLGQGLAPLAMLTNGYVLSVPVFFDTVFFLLVPLSRALHLRVGKNFVLYILAPCAGGVITHSLVPPTPGPLVMIEDQFAELGLELGTGIGLGFLLGLIPALVGLGYAMLANRRFDIPMREVPGSSRKELEEIVNRPDHELPGFFVSIFPVLLPVILITGNTVLGSLQGSDGGTIPDWLLALSSFFGNANIALLLATFFAVWVMVRQKGLSLKDLKDKLEPAVNSAGVIILITSAGGAFGKMLSRTGLAEALQNATGGDELGGVTYVLLAWGMACVMKIAQGSGTVSMITSSAILAQMLRGAETLPCHMIYIFAAIGFGSLVISWMNDSGFWVVCKMSGFTEKETLQTWTPLLAVIGIAGLIEVLILVVLFPGV